MHFTDMVHAQISKNKWFCQFLFQYLDACLQMHSSGGAFHASSRDHTSPVFFVYFSSTACRFPDLNPLPMNSPTTATACCCQHCRRPAPLHDDDGAHGFDEILSLLDCLTLVRSAKELAVHLLAVLHWHRIAEVSRLHEAPASRPARSNGDYMHAYTCATPLSRMQFASRHTFQ